MKDKAEAALKQLASVSRTLNEASDALSKQLSDIESALNGYGLGVSAWVRVRSETEYSEPDDRGQVYPLTREEHLGYGKHKGKWALLHAVSYPDFDQWNPQFLQAAPRESRLEAVGKLPDLFKALADKATKVTEEATRKAAQAAEIASSLGSKKS